MARDEGVRGPANAPERYRRVSDTMAFVIGWHLVAVAIVSPVLVFLWVVTR